MAWLLLFQVASLFAQSGQPTGDGNDEFPGDIVFEKHPASYRSFEIFMIKNSRFHAKLAMTRFGEFGSILTAGCSYVLVGNLAASVQYSVAHAHRSAGTAEIGVVVAKRTSVFKTQHGHASLDYSLLKSGRFEVTAMSGASLNLSVFNSSTDQPFTNPDIKMVLTNEHRERRSVGIFLGVAFDFYVNTLISIQASGRFENTFKPYTTPTQEWGYTFSNGQQYRLLETIKTTKINTPITFQFAVRLHVL